MRKFAHAPLNAAMRKYGWIVTGVPGLAIYTVGLLDKFKHPELMVHGLPPLQADAIIRSALVRIEDGVIFTPGRVYPQVAVGYDVGVLVVDPSNFTDWLGQGLDYYGDELSAVQLVWPDAAGRFPEDRLYDKNLRQLLFDLRRPEYASEAEGEFPEGHVCAVCGNE